MDDPYGPVYIDERDAAIASLAPGDVLVIAEPSCLGTTASDVLETLSQIGARSARVLDLSNDTMVGWHPDAQAPLDFAVEAGHASRVAQARKMRKARAAWNKKGQPAKNKRRRSAVAALFYNARLDKSFPRKVRTDGSHQTVF